ncbi:MAG: hypothetical protein UY77_C0007G0001 [Candidatus Uhrbacteria bacterium GW2011_GWA2_53_10]|uniref:Uncharacterized protein n=1 Tax=Candidatus Uhrbacteria bacterium GW2011_GWA2_53_10 TaxID=1618980 RepID=A0A0G1XP21_9BACT|nr:MAG: hypothetical protein UY77_C0007G0001 [Candidatus Uhrbacteria bacterium GW2011_GWA2_53_10]
MNQSGIPLRVRDHCLDRDRDVFARTSRELFKTSSQ